MQHNRAMDRLRIDKWLWAARFYKTRSLASDEIDKGRVHVNGVAVKPARCILVGDTVQLRIGVVTRSVVVKSLSDKRGSAPVAALMFEETPESIAQRLAAAEQRRLAPEPALSLSQGRPTKRERRDTDLAREQQAQNWSERWSPSLDV
jgi:ribosome-associated heat shock protein Hsp15